MIYLSRLWSRGRLTHERILDTIGRPADTAQALAIAAAIRYAATLDLAAQLRLLVSGAHLQHKRCTVEVLPEPEHTNMPPSRIGWR